MFKYGLGVVLMWTACLAEEHCAGNSTCAPVCSPPDCPDNTTTEHAAEPRVELGVHCAPGHNHTCLSSTGVGEERNSTFEKPLSTTTKFSPSPFLGVIPERGGSLAVGEVFHESLGPRPAGLSSPRQASLGEYATPGGEPFRPHSLEIQIGGDHRRPRPDIEIRGGKNTEIEIRPHAGYSAPREDHRNPADLTGYGRQDQVKFRPSGERTAQHREYGKPYDPGNAMEYTGYPDTKPRLPFYEGYENMKNLLKPSKGSGPYFFEDNFQEKPIQEITGDDPHKIPFPPAGPSAGGGDSFKHVEHKGGSKWKTLLKFLTTVLPIGLLFAALTPNVLVVSPSEAPSSTGKGGLRPGVGTIKRSLEAPLGPCGLRRLCQALAESPADFEQFLKAAKQGSTAELREIIKKAEKKDCESIDCGQYQVFKPTQPTFR